jgi:hypothetical protein
VLLALSYLADISATWQQHRLHLWLRQIPYLKTETLSAAILELLGRNFGRLATTLTAPVTKTDFLPVDGDFECCYPWVTWPKFGPPGNNTDRTCDQDRFLAYKRRLWVLLALRYLAEILATWLQHRPHQWSRQLLTYKRRLWVLLALHYLVEISATWQQHRLHLWSRQIPCL